MTIRPSTRLRTILLLLALLGVNACSGLYLYETSGEGTSSCESDEDCESQ